MEMEKDMIKNETKYKIMDNKFKENGIFWIYFL